MGSYIIPEWVCPLAEMYYALAVNLGSIHKPHYS